MTEDELVVRLRAQDTEALDEAIHCYTRLVSTVIRNLSGGQLSAEDVEELTADTFIAMWYHVDKLQAGKLKAYICMIAKNKTKNKVRDNVKHSKLVSLDSIPAEDDFLLTDDMDQKHVSMTLLEALDQIGEPDREILIRRYYYYQNSGQIGKDMQLNAQTVRTKLARAKNKLKALLQERGILS